MNNAVQQQKRKTFTHPAPKTWAQYLSICGIDKGVFSTIFNGGRNGETWFVEFDNGWIVEVQPGELQTVYNF